jgi:hypothetical protein
MKQALTIAIIAIVSFLLGTLMPRSPKVETRDIVVYRDTSYSRLSLGDIKKLDVPEVRGVPSVLFVPEVEVRTVIKDSIRYVVLDREHKFLDNPDVKIWYSGIDPTIDSLQVKRHTVIQKEPWKRHSVSLSGEVGFNMLGAGAEYEYSVFKWFSVSANAGYDFYMKQPYVSASAKIRLYSW